jgi:hypothetical protein
MIRDNFFVNNNRRTTATNSSIALTIASGDPKRRPFTERGKVHEITKVSPLRDSLSSGHKMQSIDEKRLGLIRGTERRIGNSEGSQDPPSSQECPQTLKRVSSLYESHGNVYLGSPLKRLSKEIRIKRSKTINSGSPSEISPSSPSPVTTTPSSSPKNKEGMTNGINRMSMKNAYNPSNIPVLPSQTGSKRDFSASNGIKWDKRDLYLDNPPVSSSSPLTKNSSVDQLLELGSPVKESLVEEKKYERLSNPLLEQPDIHSKGTRKVEKEPHHQDFDHGQDLSDMNNKQSRMRRNRLSLGSASSSSTSSSSTYHGQSNNHNNRVSLVSPDILTPLSSSSSFVNQRNRNISFPSQSTSLLRSRNSRQLLRQKSFEQIHAKQTQHILNMTATPHIMEELDVSNLDKGEQSQRGTNDCDNNPFSDDNEISFRSALPSHDDLSGEVMKNYSQHKNCYKQFTSSSLQQESSVPITASEVLTKKAFPESEKSNEEDVKESPGYLTKKSSSWIHSSHSSSTERSQAKEALPGLLSENSCKEEPIGSPESYPELMTGNTNKEMIQLSYLSNRNT